MVTVAAGPELSVLAGEGGVEASAAPTSSDGILTELWKQLELHNGFPAFSVFREGKAVGESERRDVSFSAADATPVIM